jgi:hypothetical protein
MPEVQSQMKLTPLSLPLILPIEIKGEPKEGRRPTGREEVIAWMGALVRVTYSGLTQSVFRLDRVKSSSFDLPAKFPQFRKIKHNSHLPYS